jgi:reversibly glycosylated polypeptide / UDP-arabinopyranose mutase
MEGNGMSTERVALVVPTNRPATIVPFLKAWATAGFDDIIVVVDGPEELPGTEVADSVLTWDWLERKYGDDHRIFSRKSGGIRVAGFLEAFEIGADIIVCLDDDCLPLTTAEEYLVKLLKNFTGTTIPQWVTSCHGLSVRGLPYTDRGKLLNSIMVSHGLWANVPDIDAPRSLCEPELTAGGYIPPDTVWPVHPDQYIPFSGMNFAFRAEMIYAMYFPPQGEGYPYHRFDDIWGGLFLQKVLQYTAGTLVVGPPHVNHVRASNPLVNIANEGPGIRDHEEFWQLLDTLYPPGNIDSVSGIVLDFAEQMRRMEHPYLRKWGEMLPIWCRLCSENVSKR